MTRITPAQCRAARALLDISTQLSGLAVIPRPVIDEFEAGGAPLSTADVTGLRRALEAAGVIFLDGDGLGSCEIDDLRRDARKGGRSDGLLDVIVLVDGGVDVAHARIH